VLKTPISIKPEQVDAFRRLFFWPPSFPRGNSRPIQPLNGRVVTTDVP
jgi:carbonic anhydrase